MHHTRHEQGKALILKELSALERNFVTLSQRHTYNQLNTKVLSTVCNPLYVWYNICMDKGDVLVLVAVVLCVLVLVEGAYKNFWK